MNTKNLLSFALFIITAILFSGCTKTDTKLAAENADLKTRLQKLEQQLKESNSRVASQVTPGADQASLQDLKGQLDEAQKKAEAAETELQSLKSQVDAQKAKIDQLTRDLANAQQARDKAEKALQQYLDKTAAALKEFKTLRGTLGDQTAKLDNYHQNYMATQKTVTNLVSALPDSNVRREILDVLGSFAKVDGAWATAELQMDARTKEAKADYDKFVYAGGLGPHPHLISIGQKRLLEPAEKANAVTALKRDQEMVSFEGDIDQGIKKLQTLVGVKG